MTRLPKYRDADRPHPSPSAIEQYRGCPQQFYLKRIKRVEVPRSRSLVFGTAAHTMAEVANKHRIATGEQLPLDALWTVFREAFVEDWDAAATMPAPVREFGNTKAAKDALLAQGWLVCQLFDGEIAPRIN